MTSAPSAGVRALSLAVGCCLAVLPGCLDGRLDSFEATSARGLIDDFEDQDNHVRPDGWWYVTDDGTGPRARMTFEPVTGRGVSRYGAHVAGGPTTDFGAFLGLDLPGPLFDASDFSSLSFWARMEPEGELSIRFQVAEATQYLQPCALDATWREIRAPMAGFRSPDGEELDPTAVTHLQLWVAGTRPAFNLYVDDVRLLREP